MLDWDCRSLNQGKEHEEANFEEESTSFYKEVNGRGAIFRIGSTIERGEILLFATYILIKDRMNTMLICG